MVIFHFVLLNSNFDLGHPAIWSGFTQIFQALFEWQGRSFLIYWRVNEEVASKIDQKLLVIKRNIGISRQRNPLAAWSLNPNGSLVGVHQRTTMNCLYTPSLGFQDSHFRYFLLRYIYIYSSTWYFSFFNNIMIPMGCFFPLFTIAFPLRFRWNSSAGGGDSRTTD